jgi:shikimate dehydrogenase
LSVTIPYKEKVIPFLDNLDKSAKEVWAVNSIKVGRRNDKPFLTGYNTDTYGFEKSLGLLQIDSPVRALVMGTGGASKAVCHVLKKKGWEYLLISRNPSAENQKSYNRINASLLQSHRLIINTTPLGTFPEINHFPPPALQFAHTK